MDDESTTIGALKIIADRFASERNWQPYHSPKNLCMALASEVGELLEPFRWATEQESYEICQHPRLREAVADEVADVVYLLMLFSLHSGIDITTALREKMVKNAVKYPAPPPEQE
ncbi:MAG: nucleotide pyrophosphohydrolase [Zavarzinella sp.]